MEEKWLRVEEIARLLDLKEESIRIYLRKGQLVGYKFGSDWRVKKSDLDDWVEKKRNKK